MSVFLEQRNLDASISHDIVIGKIASISWSIQIASTGLNVSGATLRFYGTNFPESEGKWSELPNSQITLGSGDDVDSVGKNSYDLLTLRVLYTPNSVTTGTIDIIANGQ